MRETEVKILNINKMEAVQQLLSLGNALQRPPGSPVGVQGHVVRIEKQRDGAQKDTERRDRHQHDLLADFQVADRERHS